MVCARTLEFGLREVERELGSARVETMRWSGVVLAAGRSERMGRDKALLPAPDGDGGPMWERQRAVLARTGSLVEVVRSVVAEAERG